MIRRIVVCLLTTALLSIAPLVEAQQLKKIPRIGFLSSTSPDAEKSRLAAFQQGLRELGYLEGQNILIEYRYAGGKFDWFPALAAELVRLKVDVLVATGAPASHAAKDTTKTIPIVMTNAADPVGTGLVASLARPGGNITGLSIQAEEMGGKRLELLKEAVPQTSRVTVLWNASDSGKASELHDTQVAAQTLGMTLHTAEVRGPDDFDNAFAAIARERPDALITFSDALTLNHQRQIVDFATQYRLPLISEVREFAEAGGLMTYGASLPALIRRAAYYVDRILKGSKPADLPVERPTKFELVLNLTTAKALGITMPPSLLLLADEVIQ